MLSRQSKPLIYTQYTQCELIRADYNCFWNALYSLSPLTTQPLSQTPPAAHPSWWARLYTGEDNLPDTLQITVFKLEAKLNRHLKICNLTH